MVQAIAALDRHPRRHLAAFLGQRWHLADYRPVRYPAQFHGESSRERPSWLEPPGRRRKKLESKSPRCAESRTPLFRAVAAYGLEVWAGASGGRLYHSFDGGNRWALVTPSDSGSFLPVTLSASSSPSRSTGKLQLQPAKSGPPPTPAKPGTSSPNSLPSAKSYRSA